MYRKNLTTYFISAFMLLPLGFSGISAQTRKADVILDSLKTCADSLSSVYSEFIYKDIPEKPVFLYNVKLCVAYCNDISSISFETITGDFTIYGENIFETGLSFEYWPVFHVAPDVLPFNLSCRMDVGWRNIDFSCLYANRLGLYSQDWITASPMLRLGIRDTGMSVLFGFKGMYLAGIRKKQMALPLYSFHNDIFRKYRMDYVTDVTLHFSIFEFAMEMAFSIYDGGINVDRLAYYSRAPIVMKASYSFNILFKLYVNLFGNSRN